MRFGKLNEANKWLNDEKKHISCHRLKFRSDNDGVGRGFKLEYNYGKV